MATTKTDPSTTERGADDAPIQLREWGTDRAYSLPASPAAELSIGSSVECWLQLQDRECYVSRHHATLHRSETGWMIADANSKNGLWIDGRRAGAATLVSGIEVGLGRVRLIVESRTTLRHRALLARLLGWKPERQLAVDRALRLVREFASARLPLWLTGIDDLVAIARRIHSEVVGDAQPFVICDADTKTIESELRSPRGGTLCVRALRKPEDARTIRALFADREQHCHVVVCARSYDQVTAIDIPPLADRPDEIDRIVDEYAIDAITRLSAQPASFTRVDRETLLDHPPDTLAEIDVATLRLVAIREFGGVTRAAPHLGVTHSALSRWLARRTRRRR